MLRPGGGRTVRSVLSRVHVGCAPDPARSGALVPPPDLPGNNASTASHMYQIDPSDDPLNVV